MGGIRESRKQRTGSLPPPSLNLEDPVRICKASATVKNTAFSPITLRLKFPNSGQQEYFLDLIVDQYSTFALVWINMWSL